LKRSLLGLVFLGLSATLVALAARYPAVVERAYARRVYPVLSQGLSCTSGLVPFSLAEVTVVACAVAIAYRLVRLPSRARARSWRQALGALLADGLLAAGVLALAFIALWGLNYRRLPYAEVARLDTRPAAAEELRGLVEELVLSANRLRDGLSEDERGVVRMHGDATRVLARTAAGLDAAARHEASLRGSCVRPKPLLLSEAVSWLGLTGIYSPFTGEPNVNVAVPAVELPFAASHEAAHQRGFAREDEASFVAHLACRFHPDRDFNYAGALASSVHAANALHATDHEAWKAIEDRRSEAVRRDLRALREWAARYEGPAARAAEKVNDAYLRSQGEKEGVRSYGRMVDLLLGERRAARPGGGPAE
jgi:Protein of unknown function (DUF3810)